MNTELPTDEVGRRLAKIERQHRIERWFNLLLGLALLVGGFSSIHSEWLQGLWPDEPVLIAAPVGAAIASVAVKNWGGTPATKLLSIAVMKLKERQRL